MPSRNHNELDNPKDNNSFRVSTQAQPSNTTDSQSDNAQTRKQVTRVILRFVATWLAFILILCGLALLTNINWARPFMQQALGDTLSQT